VVLTSTSWAWAASQGKNTAPKEGGAFVEGIVSNNLDSVDLGRLTKSGLTKINEQGEISPDLALSWEVSADKLSYKFNLVDKVTSYEIADTVKNTPTYLAGASLAPVDQKTLSIVLQEPDSNLLSEVTQPIFPHGPYVVEKKTQNEIRLKRNSNYHLTRPYLDRFIVRIYPDADSLQKAADRNKINGAFNLQTSPKNWQSKELSLGKKHYLFINSSKSYLKKTKTREALLNGTKPDGVTTLDILEVNGQQEDPEFIAWKEKLKAAGVQVQARQVALKDALKEDLPKRNYDVLYILVAEGQSQDPYLIWNSAERSSVGQNFSELANADIDELTEQFKSETDPTKKAELSKKIKELVDKEKVSVEYKNLTAKYSVYSKLKGLSVAPMISSEADRFAQVPSWYIYEKRVQ
jgi:ABC-type transport system substrate-binding protein